MWFSLADVRAGQYVRLDGMRVVRLSNTSAWNGPCLTTIRLLHSTPSVGPQVGTTVAISAKSTSPFLQGSLVPPPDPPICVTQFVSLRAKLSAPFRITIRGFVAELSDVQYSRQAVEKRTFHLVDDAGMWLRCCALGFLASANALDNRNEIVAYFGTGRKPVGTSPGMIYFMKDSMIVQVSKRADESIKRAEIEVN